MNPRKPPPPDGVEPPPPQGPPSKFRFHKPLEKAKKLSEPPNVKDELLHFFCMSILGFLSFIGGGAYLLLRGSGGGSTE